jgi:hypothetical protein
MTILADPASTSITPSQPAEGIADVLHRTARYVEALPHDRLVSGDVIMALKKAAGGDYYFAESALDALVDHLTALGEDGWLRRWSSPRYRLEAAMLIADAASVQPAPPEVALVLRRAARYIDQPVNESLMGALQQVTRDRDLLLRAVEILAGTLRKHVRDLRMWDATNTRKIVASGLRRAAARAEVEAAK